MMLAIFIQDGFLIVNDKQKMKKLLQDLSKDIPKSFQNKVEENSI